ncbi:unnamed protein product [Auanema sp. JU1783]|nr:unnamed protein product [Auanema sp. JU1783]
MAAAIILTLFALVIAYVFYYYWNVSKYPRGPRPLPLLGNLLSFEFKDSHGYLQKLSETYGDVFTIFLPDPTICIMSYEGIKDAFVTRADDYVGRPGGYPDNLFQCKENGGIIFSQGEEWKDERRTSLHILRDFGMGKNEMEIQVRASMDDCVQHVKSLCAGNKPVNFRWPLQLFVSNVITNVLTSIRCKYSDSDNLKYFCNLLTEEFMKMKENKLIFFPRLIPGFEKLPYLGHKAVGHLRSLTKKMYDYVEKDMKSALEGYDESMEPENFCQSYYQKKMREGTYKEENLLNVCMDFYLAGMETTSTTLRWSILYLAKHQDVQNKMRAEIEATIGHNFPTLADKPRLPYSNAVINEIQRKANIISMNVVHRAVRDTSVLKHSIPANSLVIAQIHEVLRASKVFVDSDKFMPERFLEEDGKTTRKDVLEQLVPFSMGKRQCAGEGLARLELFLGAVSLVQNFKLEEHPDHPITLEPINAGVLLPQDQDIIVTPLVY